MTTYNNSNAESFGRRIGQVWLAFRSREARATRWVVRKGVPPQIAWLLMLSVKLTILAIAVYAIFWVLLTVVVVFVVVKMSRMMRTQPARRFDEDIGLPAWEAGEPTDHKQRLFYHPLAYNDDPDPRFYDPRFDD